MPSALGFPSSPTLNQQYTVGAKLYAWNGTTWAIISTIVSGELTQEQVQDIVAPLLNHASHTNITASYDDDNNKIILAGTATITTEQAQDAVAPLLNHSSHTNITATYDDDNNKILLTAGAGLTQEEVQEFVAPLLNHASHSNITASYDDAANKILLTAEAPTVTLAGTETLTNKTISGGSNTLTDIGNGSLTNSSITVNGSAVSLGGSVTITTGGTSKITKSAVSLGTIAVAGTFTEIVITDVCQRGLVSLFNITSSVFTNFDIEVRSAASGAGSQMLYAAQVSGTNYTITNPWYYEADSGNSMYIRIRNSTTSSTFTLTSMRVEKFV